MSTALSDLFSSASRTRLLEALVQQSDAVALRQLAVFCDLPVNAVRLALQRLQSEGRVALAVRGHQTCYRWVGTHPDSPLLEQVVRLASNVNLAHRATRLGRRAQEALAFQAKATRLLLRARESTHAR